MHETRNQLTCVQSVLLCCSECIGFLRIYCKMKLPSSLITHRPVTVNTKVQAEAFSGSLNHTIICNIYRACQKSKPI